ncbi:sodium/potassium/calcium exchanger 3-like isoform X2 [Lineus longissimus]|uniref:sodium/potassium/calcium exchanger 3-like isoform X2 n=1 Tax=Lineus longissimus TaxID=88925 RepID=UPI002B4F2463
MLRMNRKGARKVQGVILGVGLCCVLVWEYFVADPDSVQNAVDHQFHPSILKDVGNLLSRDSEFGFKSRHLLYNLPNCTPPAIEQFPKGLMTKDQRQKGGLTIHVVLTLYMFLALALACDDYFVPSLERISDALDLQSDVAGATFMAAGSSAPELATAVIGVFIAKDDIGLGAVVGSAIFNIMFVISVCALFAGMVVYLHWWPLFRDSIFYLISIIALTVSIYDEYVQWYEAWALLILYFLYIILMFFNPRLEKFMVATFTCCPVRKKEEAHHMPMINHNGNGPRQKVPHTQLDMDGSSDESPEDIPEKESNGVSVPLLDESQRPEQNEETDHFRVEVKSSEGKDEPSSPLSIPDGCYKKFMWIISLPLTICMFFTIPDCRKARWTRWYVVTFTMSLVWISGFSYVMVWMMTIIGYTLNIPDTVMALTFVAAGVSVPDAIASLIVVKDGFGDMAVSNAIGSNVFDILLCLGLPWVLRTSVTQPGVPVRVYSAGLIYASVTLLSTVVFLLIATHLNRWRLTKPYGVVLMFMYIIITAVSCLFELNVFGYLHPPVCPSSY